MNINQMNIAELLADAQKLLARVEKHLYLLGAEAEEAQAIVEDDPGNHDAASALLTTTLELVTLNCVVRDAGNTLLSDDEEVKS